jgi:predicted DNA-binding protein (UPF0251 family)
MTKTIDGTPANHKGEGRRPDRDPRPSGAQQGPSGTTYRYKRQPRALTADEATLKKLRACAMVQMSKSRAAAVLGVNRETLSRFLAEWEEAAEIWELGKKEGQARLHTRAFEIGMSGDVPMLKHLMKHHLGQDDKVTVNNEISDKRPMQRVEAAERAAELLKKLGMDVPPKR